MTYTCAKTVGVLARFLAVSGALCLLGCGNLVHQRIPAYLSAQYEEFGPEADQTLALLCASGEATARGVELRNEAETRDFIADVCTGEVIGLYAPVAEDALRRAHRIGELRRRSRP